MQSASNGWLWSTCIGCCIELWLLAYFIFWPGFCTQPTWLDIWTALSPRLKTTAIPLSFQWLCWLANDTAALTAIFFYLCSPIFNFNGACTPTNLLSNCNFPLYCTASRTWARPLGWLQRPGGPNSLVPCPVGGLQSPRPIWSAISRGIFDELNQSIGVGWIYWLDMTRSLFFWCTFWWEKHRLCYWSLTNYIMGDWEALYPNLDASPLPYSWLQPSSSQDYGLADWYPRIHLWIHRLIRRILGFLTYWSIDVFTDPTSCSFPCVLARLCSLVPLLISHEGFWEAHSSLSSLTLIDM